MLSRLKKIFVSLALLVAIGTFAYMAIERWSFLESIYMTIITIFTVGFQEVRPLSEAGRIFTIFLIPAGYGILVYALSMVVAFIVEGELLDVFRRNKMRAKIEDLDNHYIICGSSGAAAYVINEFMKTSQPFVIIEHDPEKIKKLKENESLLFLEDDPSEDEVLRNAGITRAIGLISALPSDKDNLIVVLTARGINRRLRIVSLVFDENSDHKLKYAGANAVVFPDFIGGMRMASEMIRPTVVSFLDVMLRGEDATLRVEEAIIPPESGLIGKTLAEGRVGEKTGLIIIAIKDGATGTYHYNPNSTTVIKAKDVFITIGTPEQMKTLRDIIG